MRSGSCAQPEPRLTCARPAVHTGCMSARPPPACLRAWPPALGTHTRHELEGLQQQLSEEAAARDKMEEEMKRSFMRGEHACWGHVLGTRAGRLSRGTRTHSGSLSQACT